MDCGPPGSFAHGISQARTREWQEYQVPQWLPFPSPGGLPDPGIKPTSPALFIGKFFTADHHHRVDSSPERSWREKAFQSFLPPRPDWTSYKSLFPRLLSEFFFFALIFIGAYLFYWPRWLRGKECACHCRRLKSLQFNPWGEKIWSRKWQPAPVFLPGKYRGAWWAIAHGTTKSWTQLRPHI